MQSPYQGPGSHSTVFCITTQDRGQCKHKVKGQEAKNRQSQRSSMIFEGVKSQANCQQYTLQDYT